MKRHIRLQRRAQPTERISSFVDHLIQPTAQIRKLYLKDTTDFLNFIEKTKVAKKQSLSQWTLIAFTLTSHWRKELQLYVKHTKHSMETNFRFQLTSSEKC